LTTKVHAAVDAGGHPIRILLTQGQAAECPRALELLSGFQPDYVLADKGYDSATLVHQIEERGSIAVIPPRSSRRIQRSYDKQVYRCRNVVERYFQKLKNYRRLSSRYERQAENFFSMISLVSIIIWLS